MESLAAIWKLLAAAMIVWRLASLLFETAPAQSSAPAPKQQPFPISRALDGIYWASVWLSAQTTIWVVCGFTGVLLHWVALSGNARLRDASRPAMETSFTPAESTPSSHARPASREIAPEAAVLCL